MRAIHPHLLTLAAVMALTGCASVKLDTQSASPATVQSLREARLQPAGVGAFRLAPGKRPELDTSLSGLRGSSLEPAQGTWYQQLRQTLVVELTAAGLLESAAPFVIEGELLDSQVDAAIGTGSARLAARFVVRNATKQAVFDKELAVSSTWESSFVGAVAVPAAINQYSALYRALVGKLVEDADFRRVLAR